jgi:hypothetical protein
MPLTPAEMPSDDQPSLEEWWMAEAESGSTTSGTEGLRGRPADLPLIREGLLGRIEQLRDQAADPDAVGEAIADYEYFTGLGRLPS